MSSARRARRAVVTLALALGGCGFQPVYGDHGARSADQALASVKVAQIGDHLGVVLTDHLRDNFNPDLLDVPTRYRLSVALAESATDEALHSDSTSSRSAIVLNATYYLIRQSDNKTVATGTVRAATSFDIVLSNYSNVATREGQELRLVDQLAEGLQDRVAVYLRQN
jgi:LPS-assembly lipoprotein